MVTEYLLVGIAIVACCISLFATLRPPATRLKRSISARMTAVEMEWAEAYDRLNGIVSRITKRDGIIKPKQPEVAPAVPPQQVISRGQLLKESKRAKSDRDGIGIAR